jgi:hypothetical protein
VIYGKYYLIERLDKIRRLDLAESLKNYCPVPFSLSATLSSETKNQVQQRANISEYFARTDP